MDQYADKNNIGGSYLFVDNKNYLQQMIDISVYSTFIEFSWWDNEPGKNIRKYSWHFSLNEDAYKGYYFEKVAAKNYIKENVNIQKLQELNKILKKRNKL